MPELANNRSGLRQALDALSSRLRIPLRSGHVAYLDGWRGICILLVLIGHYDSAVGPFGSAGVEFFFVLSGTLMADLLVFKRQDIGIFLRRRVARVFPALAVYVALVGLAFNMSLWLQGLPLKFASPVAALLYFHNYLPQDRVLQLFDHTWSLAVEEHSYLLLAGIVLVARRRPFVAAAIAIAVSVLAIGNAYRLMALPSGGEQFIPWRSDVRAASVLLPFALCIILRTLNPARLSGWLSAAAALGALYGMSDPASSPLRIAASTLLAAYSVNSLAFCSTRARAPLTNPLLVWLGTVSFSIYLWQQLFLFLADHGWPPLLCLAMTLACAVASFKLVEDPARNYLNAHWGTTKRTEMAMLGAPAAG